MSTNGNSQNGDPLLDLPASSESARAKLVKSKLAASVSDAMDRASSVRIDPVDHFVIIVKKAITTCLTKKDHPDDEHIAYQCDKLIEAIKVLRGSKKDESEANRIDNEIRDAILRDKEYYLTLLQSAIRVSGNDVLEKNAKLILENMKEISITAEWIDLFAKKILWMDGLKVRKEAKNTLKQYFSASDTANPQQSSRDD